MPWQIGIDEAGYGPNLGPFVMTLVACRVPEESSEACLWKLLKSSVRRADEPADERLIVADSKQVYSPASGWNAMEKTVLAGLIESAGTLQHLLNHVAADELPSLRQETWFVGDTSLPTEVESNDLMAARSSWQTTTKSANVHWTFCQSAIVPAPRFNDLVDRWESKGAVLGIALAQLIQACLKAAPSEPMRIVIDKHGGRNTYSALLQHAFADGVVLAEAEGHSRSVYRVEGMDRPVRIIVTPKADVENFTVALASMVSKYIRELLMREFNRFWLSKVPGLKPTAGYPGDSRRFFQAIRPALTKLGIAKRAVWRSR